MTTNTDRLIIIAATALLSLASPLQAVPLDISDVPLYVNNNASPNVMFTLDDSGSMQFETMPEVEGVRTDYVYPPTESVYGTTVYGPRGGGIIYSAVPEFSDTTHSMRMRSSEVNKLYYDPSKTYAPWSKANGDSMPQASPSCAPHNPANQSGCRDLTRQNTDYAEWLSYNGSATTTYPGLTRRLQAQSFWPAVYYNYSGGSSAAARWLNSNYTKVEIRSTTASYNAGLGVTRSDCNDSNICTYAQEIQNFANWYTYHRSRIFVARAGVGSAFSLQGPNLRVGFAAINQGVIWTGLTPNYVPTSVDGVNTTSIIKGVRTFSGNNRQTFFDTLYGHPIPTSGTPLRSALFDVGQYFSRSDNRGPWGETPGVNDTTEQLSCRQNYNILMTDGYYNGPIRNVGNTDGTSGNAISGPDSASFTYTPSAPYRDNLSNTLADVGMEFWKTDLRPNLENNVATNPLDEAFWQHLVNFTVGLGVTGTLNSQQTLFAADGTPTPISWPNPISNAQKIDDLWHTAVNSRGQFFSASDPDTFASSLSAILSSISDRTSSASAAALNTSSISSDSNVYQARFSTSDWSGQLLAFPIISDATGVTIPTSPVWDGADNIPSANNRIIITHDGAVSRPAGDSAGRAFQWADITAAQQTQFNADPIIAKQVLNYLRGADGQEISNGGNFRNRASRLGDIINSSPFFVGAPSERYPNSLSPSTNSYADFRAANQTRQPMLYVGANDGMLRGFNATPCLSSPCTGSGQEVFAYVPSSLFGKLPALTSPQYQHQYYADGSPIVVDAFINNKWRSVLVSGLGAGGQGIFALDVTNPADFTSELTAKTKVLWEFSDLNDRDLGYTFGTPSIARLQNGQWAAIFSGGYNNTTDDDNDSSDLNDSTSGDAVLYIVNLADGSLIKKFSTQVGSAEDPTGASRPNGLATPTVADFNGDSIADAVYAGDLFGNVWKVDISSGSVNNWNFSYSTATTTPTPLFTACADQTNCSASRQAITTPIQVSRHPSQAGSLMLFGTGQYFERNDHNSVNQATQSFYGIWDKALSSSSPLTRTDLLQQKIIAESAQTGGTFRITSNNNIDWANDSGWYLDLYDTQNGNTNNLGERQVTRAVIRDRRIIFTTLVPTGDDCKPSGTGWTMALDKNNGARLPFATFNTDNNNVINAQDFITITIDGEDIVAPASALKSIVGQIAAPAFLNINGGQSEIQFTSGSTNGGIQTNLSGRPPGLVGRQSWRQLDFND